jgi:hypothetical protein
MNIPDTDSDSELEGKNNKACQTENKVIMQFASWNWSQTKIAPDHIIPDTQYHKVC